MAVREDKKEVIIENAVGVFSERGYYKATTALVAKEAGVTQPYVFHFFKNKEELFKAVIDRAFNRIYDLFAKVEAPADQLLEAMGCAFAEVVETHRKEVLLVMQAYAIPEKGIREHVRHLFLKMWESLTVKFNQAGIPDAKNIASHFISTGLLITVTEVLDLPQIVAELEQ
ncbi:TetR/AcrR family transcriptional regulator [Siminovitchia sp. FSL H7-0308]|uniref:TetR/AcrR family transcriptional regulator n=1 Tax=unclassified Siminovitchia TaxID=2837530 RepID=UPI0030CDC6D2